MGKLVVISAPSGAGKTSIVHYLLKKIPELSFSISACSREKRENETEGKDILLHRYVAGSAPMRFSAIHSNSSGELLPLDVALPRNCDSWHQMFPSEITDQMSEFFQMGHFLCMVFHWDFVVKKGVDSIRLKEEILKILDKNGAKYPAEHNVGHIYQAERDLENFYRGLDPTNSFNPGIGKTSKNINYN